VAHLLFASPEAPKYQTLQLQPDLTSIASLLRSAREILATAVEMAQEELAQHPLVEAVAREAARQAGRWGSKPVILVDPDGQVVLEVNYSTDESTEVEPLQEAPPPVPADTPKVWKSELPSLEELRQQAKDLGVDISDCGRAKRVIRDRIKAAQEAPPVAPAPPVEVARPKMVKTAPAVGPVRIVPPETFASAKPGSLMAMAAKGLSVETALEGEDLDEVLRDL